MFQDKVIVVTGASEGIGRALCLNLATQGARLVLAARDQERLESLSRACERLPGKTLVIPTDVGDATACRRMVEQTVSHFGGVDILVNNAGISMWSAFEDIRDLSLFEHLLRVNYLGSVYCTRYALPHLRQSRGQIVAVASVAGLTGVPTRTAYAASKHAMFGFFDSLRIELVGSGVTVTMIAPDFVVSKIRQRSLSGNGQPLGENPMQDDKIMTAEQCAALIVRAMKNRQRLLITSWRGWFGQWLRLVVPKLVDRVAMAAIRHGR